MENYSSSAMDFCAIRDTNARQAQLEAALSSNHDYLAEWDSPGYSAYWWESWNGKDGEKTRVTD